MTVRITARAVADFVARRHALTFERLCAPCTRRDLVRPRQVAMYAIRQLCPHMSLPAIGRMLGGRDHTTILHGVRKIEDLLPVDDRVSGEVGAVLAHFAASPALHDAELDLQIVAASKYLGGLLHARRDVAARSA